MGILRMLADYADFHLTWWRSKDEILTTYPYLEQEDIRQALQYGAWLERHYL